MQTPFTIEDQIAQLEAQLESLLPLERAAVDDEEAVRVILRPKVRALASIRAQIEAINDALLVLNKYIGKTNERT